MRYFRSMKHEFKDGFLATIPISFSIVSFGLVCGALSVQNGMSLSELLLMNVFVFGGAGQFLMVEMWDAPLDILGISMAALLINLRYFLMCMALHPLFVNSRMIEKLAYIHLTAEPNWALSLSRLETQPTSPLFLFGGGVCMLFAWSGGTISGYFLGSSLSNPAIYGLDFALVAMIITILPGMYRGSQNWLPWCVAAVCSLLLKQWLPGNLYILGGALAGSLMTLFPHINGEKYA